MIGEGISRRDGPQKVAGAATYTADRRDMGATLHGFIVGAAIAKGRILSIDTSAAESAPGVRLILTHHNAPAQAAPVERPDLFDPRPQLASDRIAHFGQPVALVVAASFEEARAAAALIRIEYEAETGEYALPSPVGRNAWETESRVGDLEGAMRTAPVSVDALYTTPYHFAQAMEPHACTADWRDGHLFIYVAAQMVDQLAEALAETLLLDEQQITIDSAFVGGGFGGKIGLHAEAVLASLATMVLGEPVKIVVPRRQVFSFFGHRAATSNRVRLAATREGDLVALGHDALVQSSEEDDWKETVATVARALYAAPNRLTRNQRIYIGVGAAEPVRGPGELSGLLVFESAVDELADKLGIDPVELRLRNDTQIDPEKHRPLSGRRLADCLREGARRFGWEQRPKVPGTRREGDWLIGYGVASSIRGHFQTEAEVLVRLDPAGHAIVQSDMTDLGTGTYTIVAQVAAEALRIPVEKVRVELARTDYPKGNGSGGSWGSGNTSVATDRACRRLRETIAAAAGADVPDIFEAVRRHFPGGLEARGRTADSDDEPNYRRYSLFTYGATFAEVAVDACTGEVRLRRMLGVFSAGRIINPKTARSQLIGGMIWGVSAALFEGSQPHPRHGSWARSDLAEYLLPTHADIPDIDAIALEDFDENANHLGVKGIGELGAGGSGGSVANAVFNATGVRVRDFPITLDKLLPGLVARG